MLLSRLSHGLPDGKEADYEDRNANIIGTIHRAVRLIHYARADIMRGVQLPRILELLAK
jgi:hypothetical protein